MPTKPNVDIYVRQVLSKQADKIHYDWLNAIKELTLLASSKARIEVADLFASCSFRLDSHRPANFARIPSSDTKLSGSPLGMETNFSKA